jgi:hypothetical protein
VLKENYDAKFVLEFQARVDKLLVRYETLEDRQSVKVNDGIGGQIIDKELFSYLDLDHNIIDILLLYIELRSSLDELQLDILEYLTKTKMNLCKTFSANDHELNQMYVHYVSEAHMRSAFNKSVDEDKVDTFVFSCNNKQIINQLKAEGVDLNKRYKIRDYSYLLKIQRLDYEMWNNAFLELLKMEPKIKENKLLNEINKKQFTYNKQIYYLTWAVSIITIISAINTLVSIGINKIDLSTLSILCRVIFELFKNFA